MGKKEDIINEIYIFNGKPVEGNLSEYTLVEGKGSEVKVPSLKNAYFCAKEDLKKRTQEKINIVSRMLNSYFEKEKERIEKSFTYETKRFQESLSEIAEKLMEFAKKGDIEKIAEQKKLIDSAKRESNFIELEKDKLRAIQFESQKHLLNVENRLDKTTIIYYPVYAFTIDILKGKLTKSFAVEFDPVSNEIAGLICDSCSNRIKEVFLCNLGHAVCKKCLLFCESCGKEFCKKCLKNRCEICSKKICRNCSVRCFRCSKLVCKDHTKQDKLSKYFYCNSCLKRCERCGNLKDSFLFKVSKKTNAEICEECFRNEMQQNVLTGVFEE